MIWGRVVDTQKGIRQSKDQQSLAPKDWQLVKFSSAGDAPQVIASSVLCFDFDSDGQIYTAMASRFTRSRVGLHVN